MANDKQPRDDTGQRWSPDRGWHRPTDIELAGEWADRHDEAWFRNHPITGTVLPAEPVAGVADAGLTRGLRIVPTERHPTDDRAVITIGEPST